MRKPFLMFVIIVQIVTLFVIVAACGSQTTIGKGNCGPIDANYNFRVCSRLPYSIKITVKNNDGTLIGPDFVLPAYGSLQSPLPEVQDK